MNIAKNAYQGITLTDLNIAFDCREPDSAYNFISHAHADHMPRPDSHIFCTNFTYQLMQKRGFSGKATRLGFYETLETKHARITLYPAGHILGSAMVFVESDEGSVLYTGDYRTPPSPATEGFDSPVQVDYLITEATFSLPIYRWDSYKNITAAIQQFAQDTLSEGGTPIFLAYNVGKAQEIMHLLAPLNHPVQIHEDGYKMCEVYEQANIHLGTYSSYDPKTCSGKILITPSSTLNNRFAAHINKKRIAYCSGWAVHETNRKRRNVHKLIPLSDHLDFFELISLCQKLNPKKVYITHTPNPDVVSHYLRERNIDSVFLAARNKQ